MGELVKSAVVNEAVSRLSSLVAAIHGEQESVNETGAERLEMELLKIQSAVSVSEDCWCITKNSPLLRWKAKLNRVTKEGECILQAHEKQMQDEEDTTAAAASISFPRRMVRKAKRFAAFRPRGPIGLISSATVQRFERLADDAGDYLKFVKYSGNGGRCPKSLLGVAHTMTRALLTGKTVECSFARDSGATHLLLLPMPMLLEHQGQDGGTEACLFVYYEDDKNWERNTKIKLLFHVFEAVDVAGIAATCMELLPSQFGGAATVTKQALHHAMLVEHPDCLDQSGTAVWFAHGIRGCGPVCAASTSRKGSQSTNTCGGQLRLPEPVFFLCASCIISPLGASSSSTSPCNDGALPDDLKFCISPDPTYVAPHKSQEPYEQIEPQALRELLPQLTNDMATGVSECRRVFCCSGSSTYLSMAPVLSPPLTGTQLKKENS